MCTAWQPDKVKVLGGGSKVIKELLGGLDLSLSLGDFLQQVWQPILVMDVGILGSIILLLRSIIIVLGSIEDSGSCKGEGVDITRSLKIQNITTQE